MDFDYILKRLKFDKKVGIVLFWSSFLLLYQGFNNFNNTPDRIIYFLGFFLMFYCGGTVYLDCKYIYPPVYSVFKVDMILYELNILSNYKIDADKCFSIIYEFNNNSGNQIIPVLVEVPIEEKKDFVKRLVKDRFDNQPRMMRTILRNKEFLSQIEKNEIKNYLTKINL